MSRILVVEWDKNIRDMLADLLSDFLPKDEICFAISGKTALVRFLQDDEYNDCPFDLVVTGLVMPIVDGLKLTAILKTIWPKLPVIIMSGSPEPTKHQADAFVRKPFNVQYLSGIIERLLGR